MSSLPRRSRAGAARPGVGLLGALALATEVVGEELVLGTARDTHAAVSRRVFAAVDAVTGGASASTRTAHDGVSRAVYAGIGAGLRGAAGVLRSVDRRGVGPRLEDSARGRFLVAAVNGLIGDRLAEHHPEHAIDLAVRVGGRDVPLTPQGLAAAFPAATGDVVVFLHGLSESDEVWRRGGRSPSPGRVHYGDALAAETSWTPVYLRANTGLPVADNGVALAALLDRLVASWPVPVGRLALVGHSMGGLVIRAAGALRTPRESTWPALVTDVVTLGTPHLGAPLERGVHLGAGLLGRFPESAPFGRILEHRSRGILDLRAGRAADVVHLPYARYRLVAATLASSPRHPVSAALGDLLVRYPSAVGRPRRGAAVIPGADVLHVRGGHFALLDHPEVYAALRLWLAEPVRSGAREA